MSLFYFELRKLLFHKKTSLLLLCLFALYSVIGFTSTIFLIGSNDSYRAYRLTVKRRLKQNAFIMR